MNVGSVFRCVLLSTLAFVACGTGSGEANETDRPTVQVNASGRVQAAPDVVTLNVRIVTENLRSAVAAEENAKTTQAVIAALRRAIRSAKAAKMARRKASSLPLLGPAVFRSATRRRS